MWISGRVMDIVVGDEVNVVDINGDTSHRCCAWINPISYVVFGYMEIKVGLGKWRSRLLKSIVWIVGWGNTGG